MFERDHGLILRTRVFTETSLTVEWLTRDAGRISTVAKGARRPKSPFRGKLDLFYLADFSFVRSRRSDLHTLGEVVLLETHPALRRELDALRQAAYGAALIAQATERDTPLKNIFELFRDFLEVLSQSPPQAINLFAFEFKLLNELGLAPDLADSRLTPGAREIARRLTEDEWPALERLKLSDAQTNELRKFLHGFLIYHLGKVPRAQ